MAVLFFSLTASGASSVQILLDSGLGSFVVSSMWLSQLYRVLQTRKIGSAGDQEKTLNSFAEIKVGICIPQINFFVIH